MRGEGGADGGALGKWGRAAFALALAGVKVHAGEPFADGRVVLGHAVEGGHGEGKARFGAELAAAGAQLLQHGGVLAGVGEHGHVLPVLGGAAHHGGAADVDVFNGLGQRAAGAGHGGFEGVEVDDGQVNCANAVRLQRGHVRGRVAPGQQAAVYGGVQGFHAAIEHFGKARDFGHFGHGQARVFEQLGGAAGGQQAKAQRGQRCGEFGDAGFVGYGNQGVSGSGVHGSGVG